MDEQTRSLLGVVGVLRAALIIWAVVVVSVDIRGTTPINGPLAVTALVALAIWSGVSTAMSRIRPGFVVSWWFVIIETSFGAITAALDPVVYPGSHPQSFASAWPMSAAVVVGIISGTGVGVGAGFTIGAVGALSLSMTADEGLSGRLLGSLGTIVLLSVAGGLAGLVTTRLREAELTRARAQIREEVARELHDGVLQTLAVIQRRSGDDELVSLARDQEAELRAFISTPDLTPNRSGSRVAEPVSPRLREVLRSGESRYGLRCQLVLADEPPPLPTRVVDALAGAVTEAITNAYKHGNAGAVTVFVDADDNVLSCEVRDDGEGFEPAQHPEGTGITRSIRGRVEEVGGEVRITSSPGRPTRVVVTIPFG